MQQLKKTDIYKTNDADNLTEIIVVTGSRQHSNLLTLASNIDRISSEDIVSVSSVHPSDILNRATGVHIQTNNGMDLYPLYDLLF